MSTLIQLALPDPLEIPADLNSLADFRRWLHSGRFPERGRIDWVQSRIWVDLLAESVGGHGTLKTAISAFLHGEIALARRGIVLTGESRVTCPPADLSAEPDVVVVLADAEASGRVRLVRGKSEEDFVEIEGAPDLVVECISASSITKDRRHLRDAYFAAGVCEYWIADGRPERNEFPAHADLEVLVRGSDGFVPTLAEAAGDAFHPSPLLGRSLRLASDRFGVNLVRWIVEVDESTPGAATP